MEVSEEVLPSLFPTPEVETDVETEAQADVKTEVKTSPQQQRTISQIKRRFSDKPLNTECVKALAFIVMWFIDAMAENGYNLVNHLNPETGIIDMTEYFGTAEINTPEGFCEYLRFMITSYILVSRCLVMISYSRKSSNSKLYTKLMTMELFTDEIKLEIYSLSMLIKSDKKGTNQNNPNPHFGNHIHWISNSSEKRILKLVQNVMGSMNPRTKLFPNHGGYNNGIRMVHNNLVRIFGMFFDVFKYNDTIQRIFGLTNFPNLIETYRVPEIFSKYRFYVFQSEKKIYVIYNTFGDEQIAIKHPKHFTIWDMTYTFSTGWVQRCQSSNIMSLISNTFRHYHREYLGFEYIHKCGFTSDFAKGLLNVLKNDFEVVGCELSLEDPFPSVPIRLYTRGIFKVTGVEINMSGSPRSAHPSYPQLNEHIFLLYSELLKSICFRTYTSKYKGRNQAYMRTLRGESPSVDWCPYIPIDWLKYCSKKLATYHTQGLHNCHTICSGLGVEGELLGHLPALTELSIISAFVHLSLWRFYIFVDLSDELSSLSNQLKIEDDLRKLAEIVANKSRGAEVSRQVLYLANKEINQTIGRILKTMECILFQLSGIIPKTDEKRTGYLTTMSVWLKSIIPAFRKQIASVDQSETLQEQLDHEVDEDEEELEDETLM